MSGRVVAPESQLDELRDTVDSATILEKIKTQYLTFTRTKVSIEAAGIMAQSLRKARSGLFVPMRAAIADAVEELRAAQIETPADTGLAVLQTTSYQAWPSEKDDRVHERWSASVNEVLLTPAAKFQDRYQVDLPEAVSGTSGSDLTADQSRHRAAVSVIRGQWKVAGGNVPAGGLITRNRQWVPDTLVRIPGESDTRAPVSASYSINVSPEQLLTRSRGFINRDGMSFRIFAEESLRSFVGREGLSEIERKERYKAVKRAFASALEMGRPLIEVDSEAVQALHGNVPLINYEFSEIPFQGLQLSEELMNSVSGVNNVDPDLMQRLQAKPPFTDNQHVTRLDLFGSYLGYAPVAFAGVLDPIAKAWSNTSPSSRGDFWRLRRARPMSAALPIAPAEREAMVGGWFVGQLTGALVLPRGVDAAVRIFDESADKWLSFPHPMLRPPAAFRRGYDWLPAVLESMMLAMAKFGQEPVGGSMAPYRTLRSLWDVGVDDPTTTSNRMLHLKAQDLVQGWVQSDPALRGGKSAVPGQGELSSPAERSEAALAWIDGIRDVVGNGLLPGGAGMGVKEGEFSTLKS
ncbi:MAG: hypothetical protein WBB15_18250, partial [Ornithinimicrobium sp.]